MKTLHHLHTSIWEYCIFCTIPTCYAKCTEKRLPNPAHAPHFNVHSAYRDSNIAGPKDTIGPRICALVHTGNTVPICPPASRSVLASGLTFSYATPRNPPVRPLTMRRGAESCCFVYTFMFKTFHQCPAAVQRGPLRAVHHGTGIVLCVASMVQMVKSCQSSTSSPMCSTGAEVLRGRTIHTFIHLSLIPSFATALLVSPFYSTVCNGRKRVRDSNSMRS